jgi:hypothetical protein
MLIRPADLDDAQVLDLLRAHVTQMRESSPPGTSYALNRAELEHPMISSFAVWDGSTLVGSDSETGLRLPTIARVRSTSSCTSTWPRVRREVCAHRGSALVKRSRPEAQPA